MHLSDDSSEALIAFHTSKFIPGTAGVRTGLSDFPRLKSNWSHISLGMVYLSIAEVIFITL